MTEIIGEQEDLPWYQKLLSFGVITVLLIASNCLIFLFLEWKGDTNDAEFMLQNGASYLPYIEAGEYYRLFTSMFLHFGAAHLLNNMLMLAVMGSILEQAVGKFNYLFLYLVSGVGGSVISCIGDALSNEYPPVSAGASGAIFGIIGALCFFIVIKRKLIQDLTPGKMGILLFLSFYHGFTSMGVDNYAHIGGFVIGFLCGGINSIIISIRRKHR